jgi:nicotinamide-nucleotide adenylyltransferase
MKRGLVIGRFQPFHLGHLHLTRAVLEDCHELIIAIGSAQFNYLYTDPFTAGERVLMIHSALLESGVAAERFYIIPIVNDENNSTWYAHLRSLVPEFHILYTGNEFVKCLVRTDIHIQTPNFEKKRRYNGTRIRNLISHELAWCHLVPSSVAILMEKMDGVNRIRTLSRVKNQYNPKVYPNVR